MINPFFKAITLICLTGSNWKQEMWCPGRTSFPRSQALNVHGEVAQSGATLRAPHGKHLSRALEPSQQGHWTPRPLLCSHPALPTPWTAALSPRLALSLSLLSILKPESTADGPQICPSPQTLNAPWGTQRRPMVLVCPQVPASPTLPTWLFSATSLTPLASNTLACLGP